MNVIELCINLVNCEYFATYKEKLEQNNEGDRCQYARECIKTQKKPVIF